VTPTDPPLDTEAAVVRLIASSWAEPVADEFASWLDPGWWAEMEAMGSPLEQPSGLPERLADAAGRSYEELAEEYQRLFVGPGAHPCPPYESVWRTDRPRVVQGTVMGPAASEVRALYGQIGLRVRDDAHELPDHVAIELEALAYALTAGHRDAARTLLHAHLLEWLPGFCERVEAEAGHPFYRTVAAITPPVVTAVADRIDAAPTVEP
jgi:TorA maturation chaperone TorD